MAFMGEISVDKLRDHPKTGEVESTRRCNRRKGDTSCSQVVERQFRKGTDPSQSLTLSKPSFMAFFFFHFLSPHPSPFCHTAGPGPVFTPETEYAVNLIYPFLHFQSSPPRFVRTLHSLFQAVLHFPRGFEDCGPFFLSRSSCPPVYHQHGYSSTTGRFGSRSIFCCAARMAVQQITLGTHGRPSFLNAHGSFQSGREPTGFR